jgi:hypothetical protein
VVVAPTAAAEGTTDGRAAAVGTSRSADVPEELPSTYGESRLTLMEVDPFKVYVYWELTPPDEQAARQGSAEAATAAVWALRFYDVTAIDFDGTNAHSWFDISVDLSPGNWYVDLWAAEKTYCAELGLLASDGRFKGALRSNFLQTSRAGVSSRYEPQMLRVEGAFDTVEAVEPPDDETEADRIPPISLSDVEIRRYYEALATAREQERPIERTEVRPTPRPEYAILPPAVASNPWRAEPRSGEMPRASASAPVSERGDPSVSMNVVAQAGIARSIAERGLGDTGSVIPTIVELIISGRAQPGQTLEILGHRVSIDPDGTFSVCLGLPLSRPSSDEFSH